MCVGRVPSEKHLSALPERTKLEKVLPLKDIYDEDKKVIKKEAQLSQDILAVVTIWTKEALFNLNDYVKSLSDTPTYKILCHTTQPAHFVTSLAVLCIAFLFFTSKSPSATLSPVWTLLYLGSFSVHFGAQIWMTFISGLALYFSMPRHTFGSIQKVLFPKYFLMNSFLSLITLAIFLRAKNNELRSLEIGVQAFAMSVCFFTELTVFLYLTPPLLALTDVKTGIEKDAGVGMEIGKLVPGKLLQCPHYVKIHKSFRKVHMSVAMLNVLTLACTTLHLHYLACRLCALNF